MNGQEMTAKIKLLALDLDGTSLHSHGDWSAATRRSLTAAVERGYLLVVATGRTLTQIPDSIRAFPGIHYYVVANGARVIDRQQDAEIHSNLLSLEQSRKVISIIRELGCNFTVLIQGISHASQENYHGLQKIFTENGPNFDWVFQRIRFVETFEQWLSNETTFSGVEKINVYRVPETRREEFKNTLEDWGIRAIDSDSGNMEVTTLSANKATGLMALGERIGIKGKEMMCFGDGHNDVEMLRMSGFSVAMANGVEEAKAVASYITLSNYDDGVALALNKFLPLQD